MRVRWQSAIAAGLAVAAWIIATRVMAASDAGALMQSRHIARLIDVGRVPYRDFDVHSPPLAAALIWLISRLPGSVGTADTLATAIAVAVAAAAIWAIARHLRLSRWRCVLATALVACAPVLTGALPAPQEMALTALLACGLLAGLHGRFGWMWGMLATSAALAGAPILLFPLAALWHAVRRGRAPATKAAMVATGAVTATVLPALLVSPTWAVHIAQFELTRPLQNASPAAAIVRLAHLPFQPILRDGDVGIAGTAPILLGVVSTGLLLLAILTILALAARARPSDTGMVGAFGATLLAMATFGTLVAPGHAIWLIAPATLIAGRLGAVTAVAGALATPLVRLIPTDLMQQASLTTTLVGALRAATLLLAVIAAAAATAATATRTSSRGANPPQTA